MVRKTLTEIEQLFEQTVELLQSAPGIEQAASELLELLAHATGCDWGTYWKVDPIAYVLRPITTWSAPTVSAPTLDRDTRSRTLTISEGNAGHVWRSRKPIWTADLMGDMCLPRSAEAIDSGLHGGVWFAVKSEQLVYGVIELLGKEIPHSSDDSLLALERLGIKLGQLVEEKELRPS